MAFDYATLITDRTQSDVERLLTLRAKAWNDMTEEDQIEWLKDLKGAYNARDLNRVGEAISDLTNRLSERGYIVSTAPKSNWEMTDIPTPDLLTRYISDINALRKAIAFEAPAAPSTIEGMSYVNANDIEQILVLLDLALHRMDVAVDYLGDIYTGIDVLSKIRRTDRLVWQYSNISNNSSDYITSIATNGIVWAAVGLRRGENSIIVFESETPQTGPWIEHVVYVDASHSFNRALIAHGDSKWVVVAATANKQEEENYKCMAFVSGSLNGSWNNMVVFNDDDNIGIYTLRFIEGRFILLSATGLDPLGTTASVARGHWSSNPASTWTQYFFLNTQHTQIYSVMLDGDGSYWYAGAQTSSGIRKFVVWYQESRGETLTVVAPNIVAPNTTSFDVIKVTDNYVFLSGGRLIYTKTPQNANSFQVTDIPSNIQLNTVKKLCSAKDKLYFVGQTGMGQVLVQSEDLSDMATTPINNRLDMMNDFVWDATANRFVGVASKSNVEATGGRPPQCFVGWIYEVNKNGY
jgi:hypothetical protein